MPRQRDQELLKEIGKRFQQIRTERNLTQSDLAEAVGVQIETISRYETGSLSISISLLAKVAEALNIGLSELLDVSSALPKPKRSPEDASLSRIWKRLNRQQRDLALRILAEIAK